jgi:hypothetical protein
MEIKQLCSYFENVFSEENVQNSYCLLDEIISKNVFIIFQPSARKSI